MFRQNTKLELARRTKSAIDPAFQSTLQDVSKSDLQSSAKKTAMRTSLMKSDQ